MAAQGLLVDVASVPAHGAEENDEALARLRAEAQEATGRLAAMLTGPSEDEITARGGMEKAGQGVLEIKAFLQSLGLSQYLQSFIDNGFDTMTSVRAMDEQDMRDEVSMTPEHAVLFSQHLAAFASGFLPSAGGAPQAQPPQPPQSQVAQAAQVAHVALAPQAAHAHAALEAAQAAVQAAQSAAQVSQAAQAPQTPQAPQAAHEVTVAPCDLAAATAATAVVATMPTMPPMSPCGFAASMAMQMGFPTAMPFGALMGLPGMCGAGLGGGMLSDGALFALAQLAEEAAQMAVSARAFCANPQDVTQVAAVAEAAEQAAQRAAWASKAVSESGPHASMTTDVWLVTMRKITSNAAKVAEDAAAKCLASKEEIDKVLPPSMEKRSKVPCRHFLENGSCREAAKCRFSHDPKDQKARPVMLKRQEECKFFNEGKCIRGAACAWAHGKEELDEITKYVSKLRNEKNDMKRAGMVMRR